MLWLEHKVVVMAMKLLSWIRCSRARGGLFMHSVDARWVCKARNFVSKTRKEAILELIAASFTLFLSANTQIINDIYALTSEVLSSSLKCVFDPVAWLWCIVS